MNLDKEKYLKVRMAQGQGARTIDELKNIIDLYSYLMPNFAEQDVRALVTISLITLTAILTGLGIYDKIGAYAGAGSIVPITGFANAMVSPSIEHKREGIVLGLCSNMFTIAGPVIVFGISASFIVGLIVLTFKGAFI